MTGRYRFFYSCPEAIVISERWKFRPAYAHIHDLRAFVMFGVPIPALTVTVTVTDSIRLDVLNSLNMIDFSVISKSSTKQNIIYIVQKRSRTIKENLHQSSTTWLEIW